MLLCKYLVLQLFCSRLIKFYIVTYFLCATERLTEKMKVPVPMAAFIVPVMGMPDTRLK